MAQRFLTNIDLNKNQLVKGVIQHLGADPTEDLVEGWIIYRTDLDVLKVCTGAAWKTLITNVTVSGSYSSSLGVSESAGTVTLTPALADGSNAGLLSSTFYSDLNAATSSNTNSTLAKRDASGRLQVTAPSADLDAANKAYVDAARSGLDVKASVKYATNAALEAYTYTSGVITASADGALSIDGANLTSGDNGIRILVKNETSGNAPYNGIYTVTDAGGVSSPFVLTRATDADTATEVTPGMFTFVEQGTAWGDSGWILTTDGSITIGSTALTFVQFSSAGQSIAGNGLTKTGNTIDAVGTTNRISVSSDAIDISANYVGQSSITTLGTIGTGVWNGTDIAVADGGTGSSTASGARTNLADTTAGGLSTSTPVLARVAAQNCAGSTSTTVTHNFGTKDVIVQIYDNTTNDTVYADVVRTSTSVVTVTFATAPSADAFRIVVTG